MAKSVDIKISEDVAAELRKFAFEKHKSFRGGIKTEAELAILKHIKDDI